MDVSYDSRHTIVVYIKFVELFVHIFNSNFVSFSTKFQSITGEACSRLELSLPTSFT